MMEQNPRTLAVVILNRVEEKGEFAQVLLDKTLSGTKFTNPADRGLLTVLVYGVLRWRGYLDGIIAGLCRRNPAALAPGLANILRVGLYQLFFTEKIPDFAAVNEAVRLAKIRFPGREGLVNAVLRGARQKIETLPFPSFQEDPLSHLTAVHSHPRWLVWRLIEAYGSDTALACCKANNEIPPLAIRVNRLKATRREVLEELASLHFTAARTKVAPDGLEVISSPYPITETELFKSGKFYIQDEASQLAARLVNPKPGEMILDLCAGAGGKAIYLAEMMTDDGIVVALDINPGKVAAMKETADKMGIKAVRGITGDGTEHLDFPAGPGFDGILVDAPCSGTGTLRRNPEIKWRLKAKDLKGLQERQGKLLRNAAAYLKDRGRLVYVTCSVLPEENEEIVKGFLSENREWRLSPPRDDLFARMIEESGFFRTWPHRHNTDGFFGAVLIK